MAIRHSNMTIAHEFYVKYAIANMITVEPRAQQIRPGFRPLYPTRMWLVPTRPTHDCASVSARLHIIRHFHRQKEASRGFHHYAVT